MDEGVGVMKKIFSILGILVVMASNTFAWETYRQSANGTKWNNYNDDVVYSMPQVQQVITDEYGKDRDFVEQWRWCFVDFQRTQAGQMIMDCANDPDVYQVVKMWTREPTRSNPNQVCDIIIVVNFIDDKDGKKAFGSMGGWLLVHKPNM